MAREIETAGLGPKVRSLVLAEFLVNTARGLLSLALGLFLYRATGGLWAFALTFTGEFLCSAVMQGAAGWAVDRIGAARVLPLASGASALVFPLVLGAASLEGEAAFASNPGYALFLALGLSALRPFLSTAGFAVVHQVVREDQYERLSSHIAVALQGGQLGGMALAGYLLTALPPAPVFAVAGGLFALTALLHLLCVHGLERGAPSAAAGEDGYVPLSEVVAHVRRVPQSLWLCVIVSVEGALLGLFNLALAPVVEANFEGRSHWMTILDGSFAVGALVGGAYISMRKREMGPRLTPALAASLAAGLTFGTFALQAPAWLVLPVICLFGFLLTLSTVVLQAAFQKVTPATMKGRLGSLQSLCTSTAIGIATLLASYVHDVRLLGIAGFGVVCAAAGWAVLTSIYVGTRRSWSV